MKPGREDVTAVLVTRGDVDLEPIIASLWFTELVIWNNAAPKVQNLGAYGRYEAAMTVVETPYVYFQDDDTLVSESAQFRLCEEMTLNPTGWISNMNPSHNAGMPLLALPGWGALTTVDAVEDAVHEWGSVYGPDLASDQWRTIGCDIVIPALTESRMIDLGHENLPYAYGEDRTHRRGDYVGIKNWYYREAAKVRQTIDRRAA